jgi:hypothetical protein
MPVQLVSALLPTRDHSKGMSSLLTQLHAGQRIVAVVEATVAENNFLLRLLDNGQLLRARSHLALSPGQILKLEVVELGAAPELKLLPTETPMTSGSAVIQRTLRQYLPKQQGLAELANSLLQTTERTKGTGAALPEKLRIAIQGAFDAVPQRIGLVRPEGLRQAIRNSGLFFEAKLAAAADGAKASAATDLKGRLLALVDALKDSAPAQAPRPLDIRSHAEQRSPSTLLGKLPPSVRTENGWVEGMPSDGAASLTGAPEMEPPIPPATVYEPETPRTGSERQGKPIMNDQDAGDDAPSDGPLGSQAHLKGLLDKAEGALARLILDQLASLPRNDAEQKAWHIQIPFLDGRHADAVKLSIAREGRPGSPAEQAYWSVVLELNPPNLGTLHSRITLVGRRIETYFWSGSESVSNLVRSHLDLLAARLQHAGLEVGRLDTIAGPPPEDHSENRSPPVQLVDERA